MTDDDDHKRLELALAFDTDDPEFARGVELGLLWSELRLVRRFEGPVHAANAENVIRCAEALDLPFAGEEVDEAWLHVRIGAP